MTHALKTWPEYFKAITRGDKNFELRKEDRPFKEGDTVLLQEYEPQSKSYTGLEASFSITYILRDAEGFGLKKGHCILGLKEKE